MRAERRAKQGRGRANRSQTEQRASKPIPNRAEGEQTAPKQGRGRANRSEGDQRALKRSRKRICRICGQGRPELQQDEEPRGRARMRGCLRGLGAEGVELGLHEVQAAEEADELRPRELGRDVAPGALGVAARARRHSQAEVEEGDGLGQAGEVAARGLHVRGPVHRLEQRGAAQRRAPELAAGSRLSACVGADSTGLCAPQNAPCFLLPRCTERTRLRLERMRKMWAIFENETDAAYLTCGSAIPKTWS